MLRRKRKQKHKTNPLKNSHLHSQGKMDWNNKTQWQCLYVFDSCPSQKLEQSCYKPSKWKCKCMSNHLGDSDASCPVGKEGRGKKVGKQENAPLFNICNYWSCSLLTWSLFYPAETLQLNMQCCLHGSFSAASNTRLSSDLSAICCLDFSGRDNLRILGVPAGANHVRSCLQKFMFKMASSKEAWDGEIGWRQCPEQSRGYV